MTLIDANVILRYLLEDHAEMRDRAEAMIESGECFTLPEVIAEVVYVLSSHYQIDSCIYSIVHIINIFTIDKNPYTMIVVVITNYSNFPLYIMYICHIVSPPFFYFL